MSRRYRVLFPIDFSSSNRSPGVALRSLLASRRAEVTLLHVVEAAGGSRTTALDLEGPMWQLDFIARREFPQLRVIRRCEAGLAADRILEYVRAREIDLVVLPARDPFDPVSWEVLSHGPCAVWLDWPEAFSNGRGRRICCCVDGTRADEDVVREAAWLADDMGARLTIVHPLWTEFGKTTALLCDPLARRREVETAEQRVDGLRRRFAPAGDVLVEVGLKESVLHRATRRLEPSLLIRSDAGMTDSACPVWRVASRDWSEKAWQGREVQLMAGAGNGA